MSAHQPYGDLVDLNAQGLILETIGREVLETIVADYLQALGTSAAVYEKNGDYAAGIFTSGWCRFLDLRSRELCGTSDNRAALAAGRWHCHESCWHDASEASMSRGEAVDVACRGGIRLYALPIVARGEVVGSINFGYGTPPDDPAELAEVAQRYDVPVERLLGPKKAYRPRSDEVIENTKRHLATTARLIGALIERRFASEERDAQRRLALERDVLLKETHHRVKSNLQVISSLLHLQARKLADAAARGALLESQGRLRSIALVHERTSRADDVSTVEMGGYLASLVKGVGELFEAAARGIAIVVRCDDVSLDVDDAMHCGLVVNELVTNALKHAFPHGRAGTVEVALRGDERSLSLTVSDDGIGLPENLDFRKGGSLGLQLVRALTEQLGGTLKKASGPGTSFVVRFPDQRSSYRTRLVGPRP